MCDSTYNNSDSPQVSLRECGNIYIFTCIFFSNKIAMNCFYNCISFKEGEEQNREEGEMAQTKLGGGRNRGKSWEEGENKKLNFREEGEIGSKSREEGEIGSESREKRDLPPCSTPLFKLVDRLNKYGFCLETSMKYTIQQEMGKPLMAKHL